MDLSVVMIARDSKKGLEETLKSLRESKFLREGDELLLVDTGSTDGTPGHARALGFRVIERPDLRMEMNGHVQEWLPEYRLLADAAPQVRDGVLRSFAEARAIASKEAKHDMQFWIDTDDILREEEPGKLREVIDKDLSERDFCSLTLDYEYDHDVDGRVTTILKRERVYDRRVYEWKGPCHEVLIPRDPSLVRCAAYISDLRSRIVHQRERGSGVVSNIRNYLILRTAIEEAEARGERADIRWYFYFANAARGLRKYEEAVANYEKTLEYSGSRDDCYHACHSIGRIHLNEDRLSPALAQKWAHECLRVKPEDPRGYFLLQAAAYNLKKHDEAAWWFEVGTKLPEPENSLHVYDPQEIRFLPYLVAALNFKELGDQVNAIRCVEHLEQTRPDHPETKLLSETIRNWRAGRTLIGSLKNVAVNTGASSTHQIHEAMTRACEMVENVPEELEDAGVAVREPRETRTEGKDLAIYCGKTVESWGPRSATEGLGGSERAVFEVSRRLQKRGFRVTVYCSAPREERGIDEGTGVRWQHFAEFDRTRPRGTLLYWRLPTMLELPIPAKKRVVWCHDVQRPANWTEARVALSDRVFVLSEYHKSTLEGAVPEEKLLVTQNGIDAPLIRRALSGTERRRQKIVFASSPDRGILTALEIFKRARARDPSLEFHAFYGFSGLFLDTAQKNWAMHFPDLAHECSAERYMERVEDEFLRTPGAYNHGRCNWEEMAHHFAEAGTLLYPTRFPEISCIVAMEAQASGCSVVASDYAALSETIDWESPLAVKVSPDEPEEAAGALLRATEVSEDDPRRAELSERSLERFDWGRVVDSWLEELDPGD